MRGSGKNTLNSDTKTLGCWFIELSVLQINVTARMNGLGKLGKGTFLVHFYAKACNYAAFPPKVLRDCRESPFAPSPFSGGDLGSKEGDLLIWFHEGNAAN